MAQQPERLKWSVFDSKFADAIGTATLELFWDKAPKTCRAIVDLVPKGKGTVQIVHGRHSGGEALFLTPEVLSDIGDENTVSDLKYETGDVLFCYEHKHICEHAQEDASEVAWIYHMPALPRRWVSVPEGRDPANQTAPWATVDVALNRWAKIIEEDGFYAVSGNLPRTGQLRMEIEVVEASRKRPRHEVQ